MSMASKDMFRRFMSRHSFKGHVSPMYRIQALLQIKRLLPQGEDFLEGRLHLLSSQPPKGTTREATTMRLLIVAMASNLIAYNVATGYHNGLFVHTNHVWLLSPTNHFQDATNSNAQDINDIARSPVSVGMSIKRLRRLHKFKNWWTVSWQYEQCCIAKHPLKSSTH